MLSFFLRNYFQNKGGVKRSHFTWGHFVFTYHSDVNGHTGSTSGDSRANVHSSSCFPGQLSNLNWWRAVTGSLRCEQALHLNGALNLKIDVGGGKNLFPKGLGMLTSFVNAITVMVCSTRDNVICMSKWSIFSLKRGCLLSVIWGSIFTEEDYRPWLKIKIVLLLWVCLTSLPHMEHILLGQMKKISGLQLHAATCSVWVKAAYCDFSQGFCGKTSPEYKIVENIRLVY